MIFSSIVFLVYFLPVLLLVYYIVPHYLKNWVLIAGSIFFYSWGAPRFIFVILSTTVVDFYLVKMMDASEGRLRRRLLLTLSICINLGLLFYFKYSNFFIENMNVLLGSLNVGTITWTKLILPIGISFYTFETMTYVVDVYRKVHKPLKNFWEYQLYIILFPKLIAGPIIRYHEIADQITGRFKDDNVDNRLMGFYRFVLGLSKKVFIANTMGAVADKVFGNMTDLSSGNAWIGILAYTFQIYFDFSGYSDMAIGLGKMFGFQFPENFNNPYTSQGITEFWRRWHITLGNWMRNYLYIPLGGNRVNSKLRLFFNLWFVFLISGLWHGASWNFIIWGAFHGFFLIFERIGLNKFYLWIGRIPSVIITFFIVVNGWVFFRLEKFGDAIICFKAMYSFNFSDSILSLNTQFEFMFILAILFSFFVLPGIGQKLQNIVFFKTYTLSRHLVMTVVTVLLFIFSVGAIASSGYNPFIYFRF